MKLFQPLKQLNRQKCQHSKKRSRLLNLVKLSSVALIILLFPGGQKALAAVTITPQFSNIFYMDDEPSPQIRGMYIAYQITNDATPRDNVWAQIDIPIFGTSANITLAQNEDGLVQIGPMAPNETKTVFFYIYTPVNLSGQSNELTINDSHNLTVYDTRPDLPEANSIGSTLFSVVLNK